MSNPDIKTALPDWLECVRISELPAVHEVIQAFADEPTGDQGVMIVRAVIEATTNAEWLTTAHIICSDAGIAHGHINDRMNALRDKLAEKDADAVRFNSLRVLATMGDAGADIFNEAECACEAQLSKEGIPTAEDFNMAADAITAALQSAGDGDKTA